MSSSSYQDLILYDLEKISVRIFDILMGVFWENLPAFLLVGVLFSFFSSWDFSSVLKRVVIGVIAVNIAIPMFKTSAKFGFDIGSKLISKDNIVVKNWYNATSIASASFRVAEAEEVSFMDVVKNPNDLVIQKKYINQKKQSLFKKLSLDLVGLIFWMISNMSLWFVKVTFTLAYWLPQCLIPIIILVSILPVAAKAFDGIVVSIVWIGITPIVTAAIMEFFTGVLISGGGHSPSIIAKGLISIIFMLYLIGSMALSKALISGETISNEVSRIGQSYGTGVVTNTIGTVTGFVKNRASRLLFSNGRENPGLLRTMGTFPLTTKRNTFSKLQESIDAKQFKPSDILHNSKKQNSEPLGRKRLDFLNSKINPVKTKKLKRDYTQAAYLMRQDGLVNQPVTKEVIERYKKTDSWKKNRFEDNLNNKSNLSMSISKKPKSGLKSSKTRFHDTPKNINRTDYHSEELNQQNQVNHSINKSSINKPPLRSKNLNKKNANSTREQSMSNRDVKRKQPPSMYRP